MLLRFIPSKEKILLCENPGVVTEGGICLL